MDTDIKGMIAQEEVTRGSEGAKKYVRLMRDGSMSLVDFYLAMAFEGRVFVGNGTVDSAGLQNAGAYDDNGQDISMDVPVGITVMVMKVEVVLLVLVADEDFDIVAMTSNVANATSTSATAGIKVNKFGGSNGPGRGTECTVYFANNAANNTDIDGGARAYAFWRERIECGVVPVASQVTSQSTRCKFQWAAPGDGLPAIVAGAGGVAVHVENTTPAATSVHMSIEWIELPTDWLR